MVNLLKIVWVYFVENLTTLISLGAVLITAVNVNEVRKQRIKMYEPSLTVEGIKWTLGDSTLAPTFKIWNVGYGSALDIDCSWVLLDSLLGVKHVDSIKMESNKIYINGDEKVKNVIEDVSKAHGYKQSYPHLLPVNINESHLTLSSPLKPFIDVLGEIDNHSKFENFLEYELRIRYRDINSKIIFNKFIVVIRKEHMQEELVLISTVYLN